MRGSMNHKAKRLVCLPAAVLAVVLAMWAGTPAQAEIIEEIVARINNAIIMRSEMQARRQQIARQIEAEVPPEQQDEIMAQAQDTVLFDMINEELLLQQAKLNFDMEKYFDNLKKDFMQKNEITSDADLNVLLQNEGLIMDEFRRILLRSNVPQDVLQFEVTRKLAVSSEEMNAYYAENQDMFRQPGEVTLREIVILSASRSESEAAQLAADVVTRLRAGEDFAALAGELSEAPSREQGGLVGPFLADDLSPLLAGPAFSMPLAEVSDPIAASYGFHILRVETRAPSQVQPLADVQEEVELTLRQQKYTEELALFLEGLWSENQVVVNPRYATGKLADGGPYATLEDLLTGDQPLGPQDKTETPASNPPATAPAGATPTEPDADLPGAQK